MSFTINPGKPAEVKTVTVKEAVPATVTVTLGIREAVLLAAVQGTQTGYFEATLYRNLRDLAPDAYVDVYGLVRDAIAYGDEAGQESFQRRNLSLGQVDQALNEAIDNFIKEAGL